MWSCAECLLWKALCICLEVKCHCHGRLLQAWALAHHHTTPSSLNSLCVCRLQMSCSGLGMRHSCWKTLTLAGVCRGGGLYVVLYLRNTVLGSLGDIAQLGVWCSVWPAQGSSCLFARSGMFSSLCAKESKDGHALGTHMSACTPNTFQAAGRREGAVHCGDSAPSKCSV